MSGPCYFVAHAAGGGRHAANLRVVGPSVKARCGVRVGPVDVARPFLACDEAVCQRCLDLVRSDQGVPLVERDHEAIAPAATVEAPGLWT